MHYDNLNHFSHNLKGRISNNINEKQKQFGNNNNNIVKNKNIKDTLYLSPSNKEYININNNNNNNKNNNNNNSNFTLGLGFGINYFMENPNLNPLQKLNVGPNVNIKFPKNINRSTEQKEFFKEKICKMKNTELCKNYDLYEDCYFKDKCSFAHGEVELRNKFSTKKDDYEKFKTKPCKNFEIKGYCSYGNRCQYLHIISQNRLLSYKAINLKMANGILIEAFKSDNEHLDFIKILNNAKMNSSGFVKM
jgi:hypothetical protein